MNCMLAILLALSGLLRPAGAAPAARTAPTTATMAVSGAVPSSTFEDDLLDVRRRILSQRLVMHIRMLYERTMQNVARGNFLAAKKDFDSALDEQGLEAQKRSEMVGQRGLMEVAGGDLSAGSRDLDIGIRALEGRELSPNQKTLLSNLRMLKGHVLFSQGRVEEALREEEQAVALDPKYGMPNVFLGRFLLKLGKYDEAVLAFEKAVRLDPAIIVKKRNVCNEFTAVGMTPPSCVVAQAGGGAR